MAADYPRRILIVEDDKDASEMFSLLLRHWGYEVQSYLTGESAIDHAPVFKPDVVLVDIGLPTMNGFQVVQRLRSMAELEGARMIAVTGYGNREVLERCEAAGFNSHILKPVHATVLHGAVDGAVSPKADSV
ncbi:MAG: response regulator [Pirellulales bacterium]